MLFVLDENYSSRVCEALTLLEQGNPYLMGKAPAQIVSGPVWAKKMGLKMEKGEYSYTDDQLAILAGKNKAIFISQDTDFLKAKHKAKLYRSHKCRVIFVKVYTETRGYWNVISWLTKNWCEIKARTEDSKLGCWKLTKDGVEEMGML